MEYGLRLTRGEALPADPRAACSAPWRELLPPGPTVALYFGTEFCEDRLPTPAEARASCELALAHGLEPTLLTPLATPEALQRVQALLDELGNGGWQPAVVFNDWGVLGLLRQDHPTLPRRAGRLMNRSLRDPRAYRDAPEGRATHEGMRFARMRRFLADAGVAAIETDADLEGGFLGEGETAMQRTLHLPYTFAASGRNCPLKALLFRDGDGFSQAIAERCSAPCRAGPLPAPRSDTTVPQWRAGNTLFYEMPPAALQGFLTHADRIVLHEEATP